MVHMVHGAIVMGAAATATVVVAVEVTAIVAVGAVAVAVGREDRATVPHMAHSLLLFTLFPYPLLLCCVCVFACVVCACCVCTSPGCHQGP